HFRTLCVLRGGRQRQARGEHRYQQGRHGAGLAHRVSPGGNVCRCYRIGSAPPRRIAAFARRCAHAWIAMYEIAVQVLAWLFLAALLAGFIDAIAGGGGMVTIPAMLLT